MMHPYKKKCNIPGLDSLRGEGAWRGEEVVEGGRDWVVLEGERLPSNHESHRLP